MAKVKELKADTRPLGAPNSWARTNGTYIAGRAWLDGVDALAAEMEKKWGADRLRLLVSDELREKFDRQRYLFNQAVWHGQLAELQLQCERMTRAWRALDGAAEAAGASKLSPLVWEVALRDGSVAALVQYDEDSRAVRAEGRKVTVYTLSDIAHLLSSFPALAEVQAVFPGTTITAIRPKSIEDPLNAIADSDAHLDDPIPDLGAKLMAG